MWVFGTVKFHLHMAYERSITKGIHIGNDIYHMLVQFSIKAQKSHCIRTCKCKLLQKNLQLCYCAILNVESHCSSIIKPKILFYSFSLSTLSPWLSHSLRSVSHVSLFLCSPSSHHHPAMPSPGRISPSVAQAQAAVGHCLTRRGLMGLSRRSA